MDYRKNFSDSQSLTPSSLGSSTLSSATSASSNATSTTSNTTSTFSVMQKKATNFFNNKYLKAVLYIILILYASLIAPKLPDWILPYLEYPIVKIFIIFIIGLLATQDPTAAIIATIGVTVTYLFMNDLQYTKRLHDIKNKEEKEEKEKEKKKMCILKKQSIEPFYSYGELMKENKVDKVDKANIASRAVDSCKAYNSNTDQYASIEPDERIGRIERAERAERAERIGRIERAERAERAEPARNIEHFDVMHNNNCFINHTVEHFNRN
jgi:hypothetical protein